MAYIDKTYVTHSQYKQVIDFILENKDKMKKELGHIIDYYLHDTDFWEGERALWNTTVEEDKWLYVNCQLSFIQETLKKQYAEGTLTKNNKHII